MEQDKTLLKVNNSNLSYIVYTVHNIHTIHTVCFRRHGAKVNVVCSKKKGQSETKTTPVDSQV